MFDVVMYFYENYSGKMEMFVFSAMYVSLPEGLGINVGKYTSSHCVFGYGFMAI